MLRSEMDHHGIDYALVLSSYLVETIARPPWTQILSGGGRSPPGGRGRVS